MSQIIYPITHLPPVIDIGKQTEKGVTRVGFDVHEWLDDWPGMRFSVRPTRPGETESYTAATDMVGSVIFWLVGAVDTEKPGSGTVEVLGVTEDERKLSFMCRTAIANTNTVTTAEIPEPNQPWVDQVILAGEGAKDDAKAARESAQEASRAASEAGQHSANADAKAASAAQSAASAGEYASAAEQAKEKAIAQADDAEESAKNAQTWEGRAEAHARNAATSAISSADSATASAQSASAAAADAAQVETTMRGLKEDFGNSSVFIVTAKNKSESFPIPYADRTQDEIRAAVAAGKTCVLVSTSGRIFTYHGESAYEIDPGIGDCPTFIAATEYETGKGLYYWRAQVLPDRRVEKNGYTPARTPNPKKLTIKGAVDAEYDGSSEVKVEIPDVFIVHQGNLNTSDKTQDEVVSAVNAGKVALFVTLTGAVFTHIGIIDGMPTFYNVRVNDNGIGVAMAQLRADNTFKITREDPSRTPNPSQLIFSGAVNATYDGSKTVTVNIPAGGGDEPCIVTPTEVTTMSPGEGIMFAYEMKFDKTFAETLAAFRAGRRVVIAATNLLGGGELMHIPVVMGSDEALVMSLSMYDADFVGNFNPNESVNMLIFATA